MKLPKNVQLPKRYNFRSATAQIVLYSTVLYSLADWTGPCPRLAILSFLAQNRVLGIDHY